MLKKFSDYINESGENKQIVKYRWLDYFKNQWYETKCEVISHTDKSAQIKLLEFGPRGSRPGRIMRVHLNSLVGFNDGKQKSEPDTSWRRYTDPDLYKDDDEVNESKTVIERESEAKNLVEQTKKYFEDGDMENAAKGWCEIYDLYDDMYNEDTHTEQERMQLFTEFQGIMRLFTDDEVFGITDYMKSNIGKEKKEDKGKFHIWSDSESKIVLPDDLYNEKFNTLDDACNAASDFVHKYDKKPFRVIVHVEDVEKEETVDTFENINQ